MKREPKMVRRLNGLHVNFENSRLDACSCCLVVIWKSWFCLYRLYDMFASPYRKYRCCIQLIITSRLCVCKLANFTTTNDYAKHKAENPLVIESSYLAFRIKHITEFSSCTLHRQSLLAISIPHKLFVTASYTSISVSRNKLAAYVYTVTRPNLMAVSSQICSDCFPFNVCRNFGSTVSSPLYGSSLWSRAGKYHFWFLWG